MQENEQQFIRPGGAPKNWLVESILVTIFCCMPLGIVSIVNAANVNARYNSGDYEGATRASEEAAKWVKLSFWIGLGLIVLYMVAVYLFGWVAFWRREDLEGY